MAEYVEATDGRRRSYMLETELAVLNRRSWRCRGFIMGGIGGGEVFSSKTGRDSLLPLPADDCLGTTRSDALSGGGGGGGGVGVEYCGATYSFR